MGNRIFGMLWGGMISIFILSDTTCWPPMRRAHRSASPDSAISHFLANLAASQADPSAPATTVLRLAARLVLPVEIILLDLLRSCHDLDRRLDFQSRRPGATMTPAAIRQDVHPLLTTAL